MSRARWRHDVIRRVALDVLNEANSATSNAVDCTSVLEIAAARRVHHSFLSSEWQEVHWVATGEMRMNDRKRLLEPGIKTQRDRQSATRCMCLIDFVHSMQRTQSYVRQKLCT